MIEAKIEDAVADLLYYDRKNDEDLPLEELERMLREKEVTLEDMADIFRRELLKHKGDYDKEADG